jgi:hypothetical protein
MTNFSEGSSSTIARAAARARARPLTPSRPLPPRPLLSPPAAGVGDLLFRGITLKGFWLNVYLGSLSAAAASALLAETQALVAEGALAPPPAFATRFSLARVGEAVAEANRPGRGGHKVLMCSEE